MTAEAPDLDALLGDTGAIKRGHFVLSSGKHSSDYVQCALLLSQPKLARRIGAQLADTLREFEPDSVVAPALGGLIIGHEVAAALDTPFRFTERKSGEMCLGRGFEVEGERVVIVEDVVTTGRSTQETALVIQKHGGQVVAVGSIIDRTAGDHPFEVAFRSLKALAFETFDPDSCPLCKEGSTAQKPGSRE